MNLTPTNGTLIIEVEKVKEVVTSTGFIVATEQNILVERAKVLAVAKDSEFSVGQTVYYKEYDLSSIKIADDEVHFLKEESVLAYE